MVHTILVLVVLNLVLCMQIHLMVQQQPAQYADLAENYKADANYEPGTVVAIGGNAEVTAVNEAGSAVVGVVSTTCILNECRTR